MVIFIQEVQIQHRKPRKSRSAGERPPWLWFVEPGSDLAEKMWENPGEDHRNIWEHISLLSEFLGALLTGLLDGI